MKKLNFFEKSIVRVLFLFLVLISINFSLKSQNVVITDDDGYTANSSAMLDVKSTTKGLLIPRLLTSERNAISSPAQGLLVFDTNEAVFYYYDGSEWINLSKGQVWSVNADYVILSNENGKVGIGTSTPNSKLEVKADASFTESDTLFAVKDKDGNIVFAVFPDGAKVYVNEGAKGSVGGFAVSGRNPAKATVEENYLKVTPDSTRIWVNEGAKGSVGGFAVSGRNPAKSTILNYFVSTADSTRIYINDTSTTKGTVGGFAVSGRNPSKGLGNDYFVSTPDSTRIYINDTSSTKGTVGGFAVSGRNPVKGITGNYMQISKDSTRIYIEEGSSKGTVGGFAVSGRNPSKGTVQDVFNITGNTIAQEIMNESRVMWYPEKSAFLAGELYVPDPDSVGEFSMSLGYRNSAIGDWSQAMGSQSIARGPYSTAIGVEAIADTNSFAFGIKAQALGRNSFAFGSVAVDSLGNETSAITKATADNSFAFGLGSQATAIGSFVLGTNCAASGKFSSAMGYISAASGWGAIALGSRNKASGDWSIAIGLNNKATNDASVAFGANNRSEGIYSVVAGSGNYAEGASSVAFGNGNHVIGDGSFSGGRYNECTHTGSVAFGSFNHSNGNNTFTIGNETTAINNNAFSAGSLTTAGGESSFAIGIATNALNMGTFAAGYNTKASGLYSMVFGDSTIASPYASLVIGQYNADTAALHENMWNPSDPLFIAGNGWAEARSNAMILYKDGSMTIAGALTQNSDKRLKENIVNMENVLPNVLNINPVYFEFKNQETHPSGRHIGFIAQEIEPLFPELVEKDSKGFLSVEYANMTAVLLQAVKEQQEIIEKQKTENINLQKQIDDINKRLLLLEK